MSHKTKSHRSTAFDEEQDPVSTDDAQLLANFLKDALGRKADNDLVALALKKHGIESIDTLLSLDYDDFNHMTFDTPNGFEDELVHLRTFVFYEYKDNDINIQADWTQFDTNKFNKYRISQEALTRYQQFTGTPVVANTHVSPYPDVIQKNLDPVAKSLHDWKRGVKRDQSLSSTLKAEPSHDSCHRTFEDRAHAQDVAHVVEGKYLPPTPDEEKVFQLSEPTIQIPKGKEIIQKHEATKNAQVAYTDLVEHHRESTATSIEANKIMAYIATITISDGKSKGTTSAFLTHWTNQVRLHERQKGSNSARGEDEKIMHLSRAIATVSELPQVKLTADMLRVSTKNPIDFQQYYRLFSAAAVQYDDSLTHEDDPWDPGGSFDIDIPVSHLEAEAHAYKLQRQRSQSMGSPYHGRNQRILLPKEIWHAFSDEGNIAWDTLREADRTTILGKIQPTTNPRMVQLHLLNQGEDMEELQDSSANSSVETEQCNDNLQDHNALQRQPSRVAPLNTWAILLSKDKSAPVCQANMCVTSRSVIHRVSSTSVESNQSLVDRRTNVGIAGQDCKVTSLSDGTMDPQGIGNHKLNSVSSGTAAGYAVNNKGPVILILYQHALMGRGHYIHSPGQLEWFRYSFCDKSVHVSGMQGINTADGSIIPIALVHGLACVHVQPRMDKEFDILPHFVLSADNRWDLAIIDFDHGEDAPTKLVSDSAPINISGRAKTVPLTALLRVTVATSALPWHHLWHPVGHALAMKILDAITDDVLYQSLLCLATDNALSPRLRAFGGEATPYVRPTIFLKSSDPPDDGTNRTNHIPEGTQNNVGPVINDKGDTLVQLSDLLGTAFLVDPKPDGHKDKVSTPPGYKKTKVNLVVDINHDGRYNTLLVADGPLESVYLAVSSIRGYPIVKFLGKPNDLAFGLADICNNPSGSCTWENAYAIGCDSFHDEDRFICKLPKKYIPRMHDTIIRLFGTKARFDVCKSLEEGNHPELDTPDYLKADDVLKYGYLIRPMQWVALLISYLMRFKDACVRFGTNEPDYPDLCERPFEWDRSIYGVTMERLPHNAHKPLGRQAPLTHNVDANLYHDWIMERSVTGILFLLDQTLIDWYYRKRPTGETDTDRSEFTATLICIIYTVDLWVTPRYLGVPLAHLDVVFSDNKPVANSPMRLDARLHKQHNAMSFHCVRETFATSYIQYFHSDGKTNPAAILSKHWGYSDVLSTLQPFFFGTGRLRKHLHLIPLINMPIHRGVTEIIKSFLGSYGERCTYLLEYV
ncbi:hypothetical protein IV203_025403 [Nitzschia inconspicua]|uniref:Uncharacterized protein n=1 Tax=Nitzschia inconspicua TaxID=303405 RepID=A0A9K3PZ61_9STRA|nr:hypothetical protein IV203_024790 [Nitzschia inconspicua]KAG7362519.1 hypothetical protein IV203_025403 [Nitzschia inconspicua]